MFNFQCLYPIRAQGRRGFYLGAVACGLALVSCTPQEECAAINGALADGNLRIQEIYEGNRGGPGYNQGIERQVGRVYYDISQVIDGLRLANPKLQTIQFQFVEAYQQASDYRYEAADLIANNPTPDSKIEAQIRQLQVDPEANIGSVTSDLRKSCPLK